MGRTGNFARFANGGGQSDIREEVGALVVSAVRVSMHRLVEFRPLAYLPKPFPMDALLRFAVEAAQRRVTTEAANEEVAGVTPAAHVLSHLRKENYDESGAS